MFKEMDRQLLSCSLSHCLIPLSAHTHTHTHTHNYHTYQRSGEIHPGSPHCTIHIIYHTETHTPPPTLPPTRTHTLTREAGRSIQATLNAQYCSFDSEPHTHTHTQA